MSSPRHLAGALALALVAVGCSGGDDAASTTVVAPTSTSAVAPPSTAASADGAGGDDAGAGGGDDGGDVDGGAPDVDDPVVEFVPLPGLLDESDLPIPDDDTVVTGVLDNGLRYYVRENDNPGGAAELRLAVAAGSVDEFGPSTGLAHFVEHMLFNGTEQFPENELIDVLRGFGARFGPDINAYTSFDETVYSLTVPNDAVTVELGLEVLSEWLAAATFDEAQVVAERGVVLDEWRIRTQSTDGRLFDIAADMYLAGTAWDGRVPIGDRESIEQMPADELVAYYDAWYRPDNAAVIVVGDIEVDDVVDDLDRLFADATGRSDRPDRAEPRTFGVDTEPDFRLHADPDQSTVDVEVTLPLPAFEGTGTSALRVAFLDQMIYDILVERLQLDIAAGTAPFDDVTPGTNSFVGALDAPALYAFTDAEGAAATLDALLDEYLRAARDGFTETELDLARERTRSFFRTRYDGRESTQDRVYADQLVEHFLRDEPYPSIADEFTIVSDVLDAVGVDDLRRRFRARWTNSAPHVIISAPESAADQVPSRDDVLAAIAATATRDVPPRGEQRDLPEQLMDRPEPIEPLTINELFGSGNPLFDPVEVTYPNGVRVLLNANTIVEGQVFFEASSPGGSSLVADADAADALYAADVVGSSGVGDFNQAELARILSGDDLEVVPVLDVYTEGFFGSAATADLEPVLQLIHQYVTAPRVDQVALDQLIASEGPVIDDPSTNPGAAEFDELTELRYGDEVRYAVLPDPATFETVDLAGIERVWNERFGDVGDWVFVISGDIDIPTTIDLVSSYIGTLPGTSTTEVPIDVSIPVPAEPRRSTINAGSGTTASMSMRFSQPIDEIDATTQAQIDVTIDVLQNRLTDVIRERLGDTYSPSAFVFANFDPDPHVDVYVSVTGDPDRIADIGDLVLAELDDLGTNGPTDAEFANAMAQVDEQYSFINNGEIIGALLGDALDDGVTLDTYLERNLGLDEITASSTATFVDRFVSTDSFVQVTTIPR